MSKLISTVKRLAFGKYQEGDRIQGINDERHYRNEGEAQQANTAAQRRAVVEALYMYREAQRRQGWQVRRAAMEGDTAAPSMEWKPTRPARRAVTR